LTTHLSGGVSHHGSHYDGVRSTAVIANIDERVRTLDGGSIYHRQRPMFHP